MRTSTQTAEVKVLISPFKYSSSDFGVIRNLEFERRFMSLSAIAHTMIALGEDDVDRRVVLASAP